MPYVPAVTSNITRNTTSAQGISFNFPIFCEAHSYFKERTRNYGSWDEFREEGFPVTSDTHKAVRTAFSQTPAPSRVWVGRRQVDNAVIAPPATITVGKAYGFTLKVVNNTTGAIVTHAVSHVSALGTVPEVVAEWETFVTTNVIGVTPLAIGGTLQLTEDAGYTMILEDFVLSTVTFTTSETASELLTAIQAEDNDWYAMCVNDHTEAFQLAMAAEIEATGGSDYPKTYWTSTGDVDSIVPVTDPAIDVIGKLKEFGYDRTVCDWSHVHNTVFPEMGIFSYNSVYRPGSTTYKFAQVVGVPAAANPTTGTKLTTSQQGYINDRNGGWMGEERKVNFYHEGKTVGGEWIDVIIGADWLNDQIEVEVLNLFLNQKGGKISYAKPAKLKSTINSVLQRAVNVGFLDGYIPCEIPDYLTEIPFSDKVSRVLKDVTWTGYISGAVHSVIVNGNLTYQSAELE